jgi:hypothetical protein
MISMEIETMNETKNFNCTIYCNETNIFIGYPDNTTMAMPKLMRFSSSSSGQITHDE